MPRARPSMGPAVTVRIRAPSTVQCSQFVRSRPCAFALPTTCWIVTSDRVTSVDDSIRIPRANAPTAFASPVTVVTTTVSAVTPLDSNRLMPVADVTVSPSLVAAMSSIVTCFSVTSSALMSSPSTRCPGAPRRPDTTTFSIVAPTMSLSPIQIPR